MRAFLSTQGVKRLVGDDYVDGADSALPFLFAGALSLHDEWKLVSMEIGALGARKGQDDISLTNAAKILSALCHRSSINKALPWIPRACPSSKPATLHGRKPSGISVALRPLFKRVEHKGNKLK